MDANATLSQLGPWFAAVNESVPRAERERRATILEAEGVKMSKILRAEGERGALIATAEGDRQSRILRAEGEALVAYLNEEKIEVGTEATGLFNPNHAYGSVDDAIGYVDRLIQAGADEIMFLIQMGTVPQWAAMETIRNLGEKVIPRYR